MAKSDKFYFENFAASTALSKEAAEYLVKCLENYNPDNIEKMLGEGFVRCHRSYLVGLKHIARLSKTEVILDNGKTLPLSRSAAAPVHKAFISYYTGDKDEIV